MSSAIPISIIIGVATAILAAHFQRRQWLRNTREEIRVRETDEASKTIEILTRSIDARIAAQRRFIWQTRSKNQDEVVRYRNAVEAFGAELNYVRSRLLFYFDYETVEDIEEHILDRIFRNGRLAEAIAGQRSPEKRRELASELSAISAVLFRRCQYLYTLIAREDFGSLKKLSDWTRIENDHTSFGYLAGRLLGIYPAGRRDT